MQAFIKQHTHNNSLLPHKVSRVGIELTTLNSVVSSEMTALTNTPSIHASDIISDGQVLVLRQDAICLSYNSCFDTHDK